MPVCAVNITEYGRYKLGMALSVLHSTMALCGPAIIGTAIYIKVEMDSRTVLLDGYKTDPVPYMLISVGVLMALIHGVAVIMCYNCAILKTRDRFQGVLLVLMIVFLIFVWVVMSGGILCFTHRYYMTDAFTGGILKSMKNYSIDMDTKRMLDDLQISYKCCGSNNLTDWFRVKWIPEKYVNYRLDLIVGNIPKGKTYNDHVPFTCCDPAVLQPCIHTFVTHKSFYRNYHAYTLHAHGCVKTLMDYFEKILIPTGEFVLTLWGMEWILLILMKYFYTSMRNACLWGNAAMPAPGWLCERGCCDPDQGRPYQPPPGVQQLQGTPQQHLSPHYPQPGGPPPPRYHPHGGQDMDSGPGYDDEEDYYDEDEWDDYSDYADDGGKQYVDEPIYGNIGPRRQLQNETIDEPIYGNVGPRRQLQNETIDEPIYGNIGPRRQSVSYQHEAGSPANYPQEPIYQNQNAYPQNRHPHITDPQQVQPRTSSTFPSQTPHPTGYPQTPTTSGVQDEAARSQRQGKETTGRSLRHERRYSEQVIGDKNRKDLQHDILRKGYNLEQSPRIQNDTVLSNTDVGTVKKQGSTHQSGKRTKFLGLSKSREFKGETADAEKRETPREDFESREKGLRATGREKKKSLRKKRPELPDEEFLGASKEKRNETSPRSRRLFRPSDTELTESKERGKKKSSPKKKSPKYSGKTKKFETTTRLKTPIKQGKFKKSKKLY